MDSNHYWGLIPALPQCYAANIGGADRIRTDDCSFADYRLTTWQQHQ